MKVQFNCRLEKSDADWIATEAKRRTSKDKKVSQADIIRLLIRAHPAPVRVHSLHSGTRPIEGCKECEKLK